MLAVVTMMTLAALELSPLPQEAAFDDGIFLVKFQTPVVLADDATAAEEQALGALFEAVGYQLPVRRASQWDKNDGAIFIGEPGRHASFDRRRLRRYGDGLEDLGPEGYRLNIWKKGAVVAGAGPAGTFYGLQTLGRIARQAPLEWPCLELRDWPDLALRGVRVKGVLSRPQLAALAALKCNLVVFDSPDFADLDEARGAAWARVFREARELYIEPVPVLDISRDAQALLRRAPAAVEGRIAEDRIALTDDLPAPLTHPHVVDTPTSPVTVSISGLPCAPLEDYVVEPGDLAPPYLPGAAPWRLSRVIGGVIPDGATVTVSYAWAPPGSVSLCPAAPESEVVLERVLGDLVQFLDPRYLDAGHEAPVRLNRDLRCAALDMSDAVARRVSLGLVARTATRLSPGLQLIAWDDAPGPDPLARTATLSEGGAMLALVADDRAGACAGVAAAAARGATGVLVPGGDVREGAARIALERAWSNDKPVLPWPDGLNAAFGAALWSPTFEERKAAVMAAMDRAVLAGEGPAAVRDRFEAAAKPLRETLGKGHPELEQTAALVDVLTRYLELETDFARAPSPSSSALRKLAPVVGQYAALDPAYARERVEQIVATVERQGLFVPASILFGGQLLDWCPGTASGLVELAPEITYQDERYQARALCDFGGLVAPVARIDLEIVNARRVTLEHSADGGRFETVRTWEAGTDGHLRGPLFPGDQVLARWFRVTVESDAEQAVLRELRFFARPPRRSASAPYTSSTTGPAAAFDRVDWPSAPQVAGFLDAQTGTFAAMPTEVYCSRSRTHLYLGIVARESRPNTTVARLETRDAPLWEEESVEVLLRPGDRTLRLLVNPLGARYDAEGRDPGWDGDWSAAAEQTADGWRAVLSVPLKQFGETPRPGNAWPVDFIRHRCNVRADESAWAGTSRAVDVPGGQLVFR